MAFRSPHFSSLRCANCDINWPYDRPAYDHCPLCGTSSLLSRDDGLTDVEAHKIVSHAAFEKFCLDRENELVAEFARELDHGLGIS